MLMKLGLRVLFYKIKKYSVNFYDLYVDKLTVKPALSLEEMLDSSALVYLVF